MNIIASILETFENIFWSNSNIQMLFTSNDWKTGYVCVCVFVCVCMYVWVGVFILFFLLVSSDCKTSLRYLRCSDQRSFVVSISRGFCQVPSSLFLNLSCFISKDENSSPQLRRLLLSKFFHIESSPWH